MEQEEEEEEEGEEEDGGKSDPNRYNVVQELQLREEVAS